MHFIWEMKGNNIGPHMDFLANQNGYCQSGTALLDMSGMPEGIYLLKIHSNISNYSGKPIRQ